MLTLKSPTSKEVRTFFNKHRSEMTPIEARRLINLALDIDNITPKRTQESKVMMRELDQGLRLYAEMKKRFGEQQ